MSFLDKEVKFSPIINITDYMHSRVVFRVKCRSRCNLYIIILVYISEKQRNTVDIYFIVGNTLHFLREPDIYHT